MNKIVIIDGHVLNPGDLDWSVFKELGDVSIYERTKDSDIVTRARDADYLVINKTQLNSTALDQLVKLKGICLTATGYNNVDIDHARSMNIDVCNVVGYGSAAVAQHVFAMILHSTNHISIHNQSVKQGEWSKSQDWCYWKSPLTELQHKTLGVFGYGKIGKEVVKLGLAFGMKVVVNRKSNKPLDNPQVELVDFEDLLKKSDYITLHSPLTTETQGIMNRETFDQMKDHAMLINTGRGALINEDDLYHALSTQNIRLAALDVLTEEPPQGSCKLIELKNCIITPHNAWVAYESRERLLQATFENLKSLIKGQPINVVN